MRFAAVMPRFAASVRFRSALVAAALAGLASVTAAQPAPAPAQPAPAPAQPAPAPAQLAPSWRDVPALLAAATAPVDGALRACLADPLPQTVGLIATRAPDGHTAVALPFPPVGYRGFTAEERCLLDAVPRVSLPPLPAELERVVLAHVVVATGTAAPAVDPAFAAWRDPAATLAASITATERAALAVCDKGPRTVRVVVDLRKRATRVWLPAWQFHSASRDGTTPAAQRKVKACLTRAVRTWKLPVLPRTMGDLQLAIRTAP